MEGRLFKLVYEDDPEEVVCWGMEIRHNGETDAVTYRRDPGTEHSSTGVHLDAQQALDSWSRRAAVKLVWEVTPDDALRIADTLAS